VLHALDGVALLQLRQIEPGAEVLALAMDHGYFTEALISGMAQAAPEAKERVRAFLQGKAAKVQKK